MSHFVKRITKKFSNIFKVLLLLKKLIKLLKYYLFTK